MPKGAEPTSDDAAAPLQTIRQEEFLKGRETRAKNNAPGYDGTDMPPHHPNRVDRIRHEGRRLRMYEESVGDDSDDADSETTLPGVTFIPGPRYAGEDSVVTPQITVQGENSDTNVDNQQQNEEEEVLPSAAPIVAETVESATDLEERLRQQITNQLHATAPIADLVSPRKDDDNDEDNETRRFSRRRKRLCLLFVGISIAAAIAAVLGVIQSWEEETSSPTSQPVLRAGTQTNAPTSTLTDVPTDAPTDFPTMTPSQAPSISFWAQEGGDIVGKFTGERIGDSVALSSDGTIVAVGGQGTALDDGADGRGRVRVFRQRMDGGNVTTNISTAEVWTQLGSDIAGEFDRRLGRSISLSGDGMTIAIGEHLAIGEYVGGIDAVGRAIVFWYDDAVQDWVQLGQDLFGEGGSDTNQDWFGWSVDLSLDATTLAVGSPINKNVVGTSAGHIKIYRYISKDERWEQLGSNINGEVAWGQLGISVSISADGTTVAGGAYFNNARGPNTGQVRVYRFDENVLVGDWVSGDWAQVGQDLEGRAAEDFFGWSVSLSSDGKTVACGALLNDDNGEDAGQVRVFELVEEESGVGTNASSVEENWRLLGKPIGGASSGDGFGMSVSLSHDGRAIVVGADQLGVEGIPPGYVRVLVYDNDVKDWVQQGKQISGENQGDRFGTSSACSAACTVVAAGSPRNTNGQNGQDAGHVKVYEVNQ